MEQEYSGSERTPPKATKQAYYGETMEMCEHYLKLSGFNQSFHELTAEQRAVWNFMILNKMYLGLSRTEEEAAKILAKTLDTKSNEHKRMLSFIRPGGNLKCLTMLRKRYLEFIANQDWRTIFALDKRIMPFIYYQDPASFTCTFCASASTRVLDFVQLTRDDR